MVGFGVDSKQERIEMSAEVVWPGLRVKQTFARLTGPSATEGSKFQFSSGG